MSRGDGRRALFHDEGHYDRLTRGLAEEVVRSGWEVIAFCWMPNHIHLLLRTPEPNLSSGMQHWLSGYANWYAKRNRRTGHLFQGRYKSFLVENESYFWPLSRYLHLNPCRTGRPLAEKPDRWPHSSYAGYARKSARNDFVQYELLHNAWRGECGGKDAAAAYRRYVLEGRTGAVENPLKSALREWVIGSEEFLKRMVALAEGKSGGQGKVSRRMRAYTVEEIVELVAQAHEVAPSDYVGFRRFAAGREMAALLCRRHTGCTLAELSQAFGLGHPVSSSNLVREALKREKASPRFRKRLRDIESTLLDRSDRMESSAFSNPKAR